MSSALKITLCSLAAVLLIALLVWALVFDFSFPVLHLGGFDDANYTVMDAGGEISLSDEIQALDINWSSGSIRICAYEGSRIVLRETPQEKEKSRLRYRVENGTLTIQEQPRALFSISEKSLEILLPTEIAQSLTAVELDIASADVTLDALTAAELDVDTASGDVTATRCSFRSVNYSGASSVCNMDDCTIGEFDMDTASGNATVTGSVQEISFDSASGDLRVTTSVAPRNIEIDTASGDIDLTIPADAQFTLEYDALSGKQNISDFVGSFSNDRFVCGDGSARYEFDSASGNLSLHAGK